ncbi:MAG TPA: GNAT family N-acetyltransferase [Polyangiaceae bacterium]|nr:GNAT family N-acetyltransferase [Polyangiaceae bacterium]
MTSIEPLAPADRGAAVALLAAQFAEHAIALDEARLVDALAGLVDSPGRGAVLLARVEAQPVGLAALTYTWSLERGGLVAWLDELYVVPARRGAGLGRALLDRAVTHALAQGCLALELEVDHGHARAERLYQRSGFVRLPRTRWVRPFGAPGGDP